MKTKENTMTIQLNDHNDPQTIRSLEISKKYGPILEKINQEGRYS